MKNTMKKIIFIFVVLMLTPLYFSVVSMAEETENLDCSVIGHELEAEWTIIIKPTCKDEGLNIKRCIHSYKDSNGNEVKCNYYISQPVPADRSTHILGEWIVDENSPQPVCVVGRKFNRYCPICNLKVDVKIESVPHDWIIGVYIPATCTVNGYCKMICLMCGKETIFDELSPGFPNEFEDTVIDDGIASLIISKGHKFESTVLSEATHLTEGVLKYACLNCAYDYTVKIEKLKEHTYTKIVFEATCTANSYECYKCTCGIEKDKIEFPDTALGHSYTESIILPPTCNTVGQKQFYCTTCHTYKHETIPTNDEHIDNDNNGYCDRCNVLFAYTEGDYHYTVKDGKATIIYVDNTISGDIVIPSTLGGYPVTAIGDEAFIECYYLTSVTIPETVTEIGEFCFAYCIALKEVVIPENILTIGEGAFAYCMSLEKLIVDNSETSIGEFVAYTDLTVAEGYATEEWIEKFYAIMDAENNGTADDSMYNDILAITVMHDEPVAIPTVTIYGYDPSTAKNYADENGIPFKNISELEESHTCTFSEWFTETEPTLFSEGVSKRVCECGEFETKPIAKLESASAKDETTNVEITYTEENFESEVEIVVSEEEINANIVFGDEYENYKSYDISLEANGEKVQPNGYVTVKLPLPEGFNAETISVYYVDDEGNKTLLESKTENGFVIFETNHFSEYVIIDESTKIEPPHKHSYTASTTPPTCTEKGYNVYTCACGDTYTETIEANGHDFDGSKCKNCDYDKADDCSCNCHKGGFMGFIWKIINFFNKLFKSNQICSCGAKHW